MPESQQHLLIVDSDAPSLRVLEVMLRKAGFHVACATDLAEAQAYLASATPDLIVSEVFYTSAQPGVTEAARPTGGYDLLRMVRASTRFENTAFVFVTALTDVESKIAGLELGADEFLTKPIFAKEIVARLRLILQRRSHNKLTQAAAGDRTRFAGQLADMGVVDLLQTVEISRKSGAIALADLENQVGTIYFKDGSVVDAQLGILQGERAIYRFLTWLDGNFEVTFRDIPNERRITTSTQAVLMEGLRRLDEWNRLCEQLPPLGHRLDFDMAQVRRRLGDVPDEYNDLLRLLDGKRTALQVIDASGVADLEALAQLAKLYFEGLLQDRGPAEGAGAEAVAATAARAVGGNVNPAHETVSFEEAFDGVPSRVTESEHLEQLRMPASPPVATITPGSSDTSLSTEPKQTSPHAAKVTAPQRLAIRPPITVPAVITPRRLKPNTAPLGQEPLRSARNPLDSLSPPISGATPRTITSKAAEIARAALKANDEFESDTATRQIVPLGMPKAASLMPGMAGMSQGQMLLAQLARTAAPSGDEPLQRVTITPRARRTGAPLAGDGVPVAIGLAHAQGGSGEISSPRQSRRRSALIDAAIVQAAVEPSGAIARSAGLVEHEVNEFSSTEVTEEMTDPGLGKLLRPRGLAQPRLLPAPLMPQTVANLPMPAPPVPWTPPSREEIVPGISNPPGGGVAQAAGAIDPEAVTAAREQAAAAAAAREQAAVAAREQAAAAAREQAAAAAREQAAAAAREQAAAAAREQAAAAAREQAAAAAREQAAAAAREQAAAAAREQAAAEAAARDLAAVASTSAMKATPLAQALQFEEVFSNLGVDDHALTTADVVEVAEQTPALSRTRTSEHSAVTELSVSRVAPRAPTATDIAVPRTRTRARESTGTSAYLASTPRRWPMVLLGAICLVAVAVAALWLQARGGRAATSDQPVAVPSNLQDAASGGAGLALPDAATPDPIVDAMASPKDAAIAIVPPPVDAAIADAPPPTTDREIELEDSGDAGTTEPYRKHLSEARARLEQSDLPRARLAIEKSLAAKRTARALLVKADILRRQGENTKALATIDEALAMSSNYANAWDARGRLLWSLGRKAEARAAWGEYLKRKPTGDTAERIREIIGP
ncbi:MAG: DUF4388 domain-containing protein [Myxococcales bacterium]|nr:DUF4388 domain-containing protein [Myxococcales bacterium]